MRGHKIQEKFKKKPRGSRGGRGSVTPLESGGSQVHALWDCHKQQVQSGEVRTLGCARKQIEFQVRMF